MKLNTFKKEYGLLEFNYHIDNSYKTPINILELLIETNDTDEIREELGGSFLIETEDYTYKYNDFNVEECYLVNNDLLLVVCIK